MPRQRSDYSAAERHLAACHVEFQELIRRVGPCGLKPDRDYFRVLVRTIVSQQLSTKSARSIYQRLSLAVQREGISAQSIRATRVPCLRACGLSSGKIRALRDLSRRIVSGDLDLSASARLADEQVRESLLEVHGIGPWSVDMFLMFGLGRMDVLPVGDFGFRAGVRDLFGLPEMPTPPELQEMAEPWRPYRSVAAWYCWRVRDAG